MSEQDNKQQTQPNPELWARFIEAVKAGRVDGIEWDEHWGYLTVRGMMMVLDERSAEIDHLCAELRRWMRGRNFDVADDGKCLSVNSLVDGIDPVDGITRECREINIFCDTEDLDNHLQAALWVLEREGAE